MHSFANNNFSFILVFVSLFLDHLFKYAQPKDFQNSSVIVLIGNMLQYYILQ